MAPAIALIVATTIVPTGLRHPALTYIENTFSPSDFINNLFLYFPLGLALSGTSFKKAFVYGLSLSALAEVLQLGIVDRIPSFLDILSNTLGTLIGYAAATWWFRATGRSAGTITIPRQLAAVGVLVAGLGALTLVHHRPQSDFSNWNPTFHLAVGDELNGGRPWLGTVSQLQIYPFAMPPSQISDLAGRGALAAPVSLPPGGLLPQTTSVDTSRGRLLSNQQERTFFDALVRQNRLTILLSMHPSTLDQNGPARIVTYSLDSFDRNFTLGQVQKALTFRLRTPDSGGNGTAPALYTGPVLTPGSTAFVAVVYDGHVSTLYVDGKAAGRADLSAKRPHLPKRILSWLPGSIPVHEVELVASEMLLSSLMVMGVFAFGGYSRSLPGRFIVAGLTGTAMGAFIWTFGVSQRGLGVRILLECIAAALVIAGSVEMSQLPEIL
jgi:VanZ like family/Concanavalin A-like lectin/glucanases superfamily